MWNGFGKPDSKRDGKQKGWRIITGIKYWLSSHASILPGYYALTAYSIAIP